MGTYDLPTDKTNDTVSLDDHPANHNNANSAINDVDTRLLAVESGASAIPYDHTASGLAADDVQGAIDEVVGDLVLPDGLSLEVVNGKLQVKDVDSATSGEVLQSDGAGGLAFAPGNLTSATGTHAQRLAATHQANRLWKETDTGLIYLDDGANWIIWKGDGHVVTSGVSVGNSPTFVDVPGLTVPIEAGETWFVQWYFLGTASTVNPDWACGWSFSGTGLTAKWGINGTGVSGGTWLSVATSGTAQQVRSLGGSVTFGGLAGSQGAWLAGYFYGASAGGTLQARAGQAVPTNEAQTVDSPSHLHFRRLA